MLTIKSHTQVDFSDHAALGLKPLPNLAQLHQQDVDAFKGRKRDTALKVPAHMTVECEDVFGVPFIQKAILRDTRTGAVYRAIRVLPNRTGLPTHTNHKGEADIQIRRLDPVTRQAVKDELLNASRNVLTSNWLLPHLVHFSPAFALLDWPDSRTDLHQLQPTSFTLLTGLIALCSEFTHMGAAPPAAGDPGPPTVNEATGTPHTEEERAKLTQEKHRRMQELINQKYNRLSHELSSVWFPREFVHMYAYSDTFWQTEGDQIHPREVNLQDPALQSAILYGGFQAILTEYTHRHTLLLEARAASLQGWTWGSWPSVLVGRTKDPMDAVPEKYRPYYSAKHAQPFDVHSDPSVLKHQLGFIHSLRAMLNTIHAGTVAHSPRFPALLWQYLKGNRYQTTDFGQLTRAELDLLELTLLAYFFQILVHPNRAKAAKSVTYLTEGMLVDHLAPTQLGYTPKPAGGSDDNEDVMDL